MACCLPFGLVTFPLTLVPGGEDCCFQEPKSNMAIHMKMLSPDLSPMVQLPRQAALVPLVIVSTQIYHWHFVSALAKALSPLLIVFSDVCVSLWPLMLVTTCQAQASRVSLSFLGLRCDFLSLSSLSSLFFFPSPPFTSLPCVLNTAPLTSNFPSSR